MKKLLIVDDEEAIREVFESIMKIFYRKEVKNGELMIRQAQNGFEAVEMAKDFNPDLVLMDVSMPVMDGIDAFYRMKATNANVPRRVYFITGFASDGTIGNRMTSAINDGALGYLSKPISSNDLKELVDRYLMS